MEVAQGHENVTGAKDAQSSIFTTYRIEEYLLHGKVHYTSVDGTKVIQYDEDGYVVISWRAYTYGQELECPHQLGHTWVYLEYFDGGHEWKDAGEGLEVKCTGTESCISPIC